MSHKRNRKNQKHIIEDSRKIFISQQFCHQKEKLARDNTGLLNDERISQRRKVSQETFGSFAAAHLLGFDVPAEFEKEIPSHPKEYYFKLLDRRLVDIPYFLGQLQQLKHHGNVGCNFHELVVQSEARDGLNSCYKFKCRNCGQIKAVWTNRLDLRPPNSEVVRGMLKRGGDLKQLNHFLEIMGVPTLSHEIFEKERRKSNLYVKSQSEQNCPSKPGNGSDLSNLPCDVTSIKQEPIDDQDSHLEIAFESICSVVKTEKDSDSSHLQSQFETISEREPSLSKTIPKSALLNMPQSSRCPASKRMKIDKEIIGIKSATKKAKRKRKFSDWESESEPYPVFRPAENKVSYKSIRNPKVVTTKVLKSLDDKHNSKNPLVKTVLSVPGRVLQPTSTIKDLGTNKHLSPNRSNPSISISDVRSINVLPILNSLTYSKSTSASDVTYNNNTPDPNHIICSTSTSLTQNKNIPLTPNRLTDATATFDDASKTMPPAPIKTYNASTSNIQGKNIFPVPIRLTHVTPSFNVLSKTMSPSSITTHSTSTSDIQNKIVLLAPNRLNNVITTFTALSETMSPKLCIQNKNSPSISDVASKNMYQVPKHLASSNKTRSTPENDQTFSTSNSDICSKNKHLFEVKRVATAEFPKSILSEEPKNNSLENIQLCATASPNSINCSSVNSTDSNIFSLQTTVSSSTAGANSINCSSVYSAEFNIFSLQTTVSSSSAGVSSPINCSSVNSTVSSTFSQQTAVSSSSAGSNPLRCFPVNSTDSKIFSLQTAVSSSSAGVSSPINCSSVNSTESSIFSQQTAVSSSSVGSNPLRCSPVNSTDSKIFSLQTAVSSSSAGVSNPINCSFVNSTESSSFSLQTTVSSSSTGANPISCSSVNSTDSDIFSLQTTVSSSSAGANPINCLFVNSTEFSSFSLQTTVSSSSAGANPISCSSVNLTDSDIFSLQTTVSSSSAGANPINCLSVNSTESSSFSLQTIVSSSTAGAKNIDCSSVNST